MPCEEVQLFSTFTPITLQMKINSSAANDDFISLVSVGFIVTEIAEGAISAYKVYLPFCLTNKLLSSCLLARNSYIASQLNIKDGRLKKIAMT